MALKKGIDLTLTYKSDFSDLEKDKAKLKTLRDEISKTPILIPIKLDLSGMADDIKKATTTIKAEMAQAMSAGSVSGSTKNGIFIPDTAMKSMREFGSASTDILKTTETHFDKTGKKIRTEVRQIEDGLKRIDTLKAAKGEDFKPTSTTIVDERPAADLRNRIKAIDSEFGKNIGSSQVLKDTGKEIDLLTHKARQYSAALSNASNQGLFGTSEFTKAQRSLDRINDRINRLTTGSSIEKFKADLAGVNKYFDELIARQTGARNTVKQIELMGDKAARLQRILEQAAASGLGNTTAYRAAESQLETLQKRATLLSTRDARSSDTTRVDNLLSKIERRNQEQIKANKLEEAHARSINNTIEREKELNRVYEERKALIKGNIERLSKIETAARSGGRDDLGDKASRRIAGLSNQYNQIDLDRTRDASASSRKEREQQLSSALDKSNQLLKSKLAHLKVEEREIKLIKDKEEREARINQILEKRSAILASASSQQKRIAGIAQTEGFAGTARTATNSAARVDLQAINNVNKLTEATRRSGHALDFHSSSLLKNAATFLKWFGPMQVVMGALNAISSGVDAAVRIDRQFATLQAVFQGTAAEAAKLKEETLQLAVAQGRSTDESIDAAIRFSRLGLTRVQVLQATETALIAANVAEISAAEAAEKLSSIYAAFNLSVGDLPDVLNRLNAISNRYNVTNKDLLEGISRVGGIAKQAGLELTDLEGVIASVTGATGRPGQEIGNALKFLITRIRTPEVVDKLQKDFNIDLTGPTGEIKDFSTILEELSAIYPTLTRNQQANFLNLTAGSRQASRFALVLDNYRQAQILAAEAAFDNSSAVDENQKVLGSLSSKLQSLKSSWENLFVAIGDSGILDLLGSITDELSNVTTGVGDAIAGFNEFFTLKNPNKPDSGQQPIKLRTREERRAAGSNLVTGLVSDIDEDQLNRRIEVYENIVKKLESGQKLYTNDFKDSAGNRPRQISNNLEIAKKDLETLQKVRERAIGWRVKEEGKKQIDELTTSTTILTQRLSELRGRMEGLQRSEKIFGGLADQMEAGTISGSKLNTEFNNAARLILNLQNGEDIFSETYVSVNKLISEGKMDEAVAKLRGIQQAFKEQSSTAQGSFLAEQDKTAEQLKNKITEINNELNKQASNLKGTDTSGQQAILSSMDQLRIQLKQVQDEYSKATTAKREFEKPGLNNNQLSNLKKYIEGISKISQALGEAVAESVIAESDTPERSSARQLASLNMQLAALEKINELTISRASNDEKLLREKDPLTGDLQGFNRANAGTFMEKTGDLIQLKQELNSMRYSGDDVALEEFVAQREKIKAAEKDLADFTATATKNQMAENDDLIAAHDAEIAKVKEAIEIKKEELRIEQAKQELINKFNEGARSSTVQNRQFLIGGNSTEQALNQSQAILNNNRNLGRSYPTDDADTQQIRGRALQDEATLRQNINSLEERSYQITADKANLEYEIAETLKRNTEERSKQLQLASREDQLRAAAAAGAIQARGGSLDRNTFQFLDQNTRGNINQFLPNKVEGLDDASRDFARRNEELNRESQLITSSLEHLRKGLETFSQKIDSIPLPNGADGSKFDFKPGQDAINNKEGIKPVYNFDTGPINLNFDLSRISTELYGLLKDHIDTRIGTELEALRRGITAGPNTQPANSVVN